MTKHQCNLIWISVAMFVLNSLCGFSQPQTFNKKYIDSIGPLLNTLPNNSEKVDHLAKIASMYILLNPDSSLQFSQKGEAIATEIGYKKGEINCLVMNAWALSIMGEWVKATVVLNKAIPISEKYEPIQLPLLYNAMFFTYAFNRDFEQAVPWIIKSRNSPYFSQIPDDDKWGTYVQFGLAYAKMGKLDSAEVYADTILNFIKTNRVENEAIVQNSHMLLGIIALGHKDYPSALHYFRLSSSEIGLAKVFQESGVKDSAIFYATKSLNDARLYKSPTVVLESAQILASEYAGVDDRESNRYLNMYIAVSDSLNSTAKSKQIEKIRLDEQQTAFEIAKRETANRNRIIQVIFIGALLSVSFFSYLIWRNYKNNLLANKKLEASYAALQSAQAQLIQSEKMASLGELTAGIAHEIQNPLNFVNNFSDLNTELLDELQEELKKGDVREAAAIAANLKENETKINLHGKRADSIVKSMLQHSRSSSGQKEFSDLNKLVDEYVRLAYHGFRARKKDFDVKLDIQFDPGVGGVNIVAQDIGRVLLNLLNNAFQAVEEKALSAGPDYQPTVTVSIGPAGNKTARPQTIAIAITDNGPGIPDAIKDKIFQPFFTTKPTGQGTGLGLSLAYDIIKAHGGEINVMSSEGMETKFTVVLPIA